MRALGRADGPRCIIPSNSWGAAPGCLGVAPLVLKNAAPLGLKISIPHIPFIKCDVVAFEEGAVFVLEGFFLMMFALVGDVLADGFHVGFGDGEGTVSGLPCEGGEFRALGFDPFGGGFFDVFDDLADGHGSRQIEEQVGVVFHGVDENGSTSEILQYRGHVGVEGGSHGVRDDGFAVFGAEDEMDVKAGEGLGHRLGRPFRALDVFSDGFPGRCPGLAWGAPLGRKTFGSIAVRPKSCPIPSNSTG